MMGTAPTTVNAMPDLLLGTYTRDTAAEGIYALCWDAEARDFGPLRLAAEADNPSFLVSDRERVFAVNEVADYLGRAQGALTSYRLDGAELRLDAVAPTGGADPCHVAVAGASVAVANYGGANVSVYRYAPGQLEQRHLVAFSRTGPHPRQAQPHPHGVYFRGDELWVADLGGDRIFRLDVATGAVLDAIVLAPGCGPRHLAFPESDAAGRCYVIHELANQVELLQAGRSLQRRSTLPDAARPSGTAELALTGRGAGLVGSNRGQDSLVSFAVDTVSGELSDVRFHDCGGAHPRHFTVTRDGCWLLVANRDTDNVCALPLDGDGRPGAVAAQAWCPAPVCVIEV